MTLTRLAPFGASAWNLAWWRHAAPAAAELRVVVVRDDAGIVGIAPLYARRDGGVTRYGVLGDTVCSPVVPLVRNVCTGDSSGNR